MDLSIIVFNFLELEMGLRNIFYGDKTVVDFNEAKKPNKDKLIEAILKSDHVDLRGCLSELLILDPICKDSQQLIRIINNNPYGAKEFVKMNHPIEYEKITGEEAFVDEEHRQKELKNAS